jgi:hypothetical protein
MKNIRFLNCDSIMCGTIVSEIFNDGNDSYYAVSCDEEVEHQLTESEIESEYGCKINISLINGNLTIVNTKCIISIC